jgi:hypothetical protein
MQRVPVESRSIASIGYVPQERVLELEFRQSGEVYRYFDVPAEEHAAFLGAESKGTYLNQQFKLRGYHYLRVQSTPK